MKADGNEGDFIIPQGTLKFLRLKQCLSVDDLAIATGCAPKTLRFIENGSRKKGGVEVPHYPRASTVRVLAEALQVSPKLLWLTPLELSTLFDDTPSIHCSASTNPADFDLPSQLAWYKDQLAMSTSLSSNEESSDLIRELIKQVCILLETRYTWKSSEENSGKAVFRYASSGLIDHGPVKFASDLGWRSLVHQAGLAALRYGGEFKRTFFVVPRPYSPTETRAILSIITDHLRNRHTVSFIDDRHLTSDLRHKCNIGLMGNSAMVAATNLVNWDLDFTQNPQTLAAAEQQHVAYSEEPLFTFKPGDEVDPDRITQIVREVFPQIEQDDATLKGEDHEIHYP